MKKKKEPDFQYHGVKPTGKEIQTKSRSEGSVDCGFHRFCNMNDLFQVILRNNTEALSQLGFDVDTIKFSICLKDADQEK